MLCLGIVLLPLTGCRVGPDYQRPVLVTPSEWHWKNSAASALATTSAPDWRAFNDAKLSELESQARDANQDIAAAVARVDETRALARSSKADLFPQLSLQPAFKRTENSGNPNIPGISSFAGKKGVGSISGFRNPYNDFQFPLDASYEADVWGRIRRGVAAARDRFEASIADSQTVQLTVAGDVASNYFMLRTLDGEIDVLKRSLDLRMESVDLTTKQFKMGVTDELDVSRAKTEQSTTEAALADVRRQREQVVNALAILCGRPASDFKLEVSPLAGPPPEIPAGLPSDLLERRPDVVRAERLLAAASEDIGVAKAAFFPRLSLTATGGFESADLSKLFDTFSTFGTVAANIVQPLFTGGRNKAQLNAAKARYEQAQAQYRQQVLVAFKEVEDALVEIKYRGEQAKAIGDAIESARKVTKLATLRYEGGRISYLDVVDAQRQQLTVEQQGVEILGLRMVATVRLIKALGGGWNECPVPTIVVTTAAMPVEQHK